MQAFYSHLSKQLGYYASVLLSEGGLNLMFVTNYSKEERMAAFFAGSANFLCGRLGIAKQGV